MNIRKIMLFAAMTAAGTACAAGFTAQSYVQDGLIAHWDGLENVGYGTNDVKATVWKNLVPGGLDLTIKNGTWTDCALQSNGKLAANNTSSLDYQTLEIVFKSEKTGAYTWLFSNGVSKYCVLANNRTQWINNRGITTFNYNMTGQHSLSWVNDKAAYIDGVATTYGNYNDTWGAGNSGVHIGARYNDGAYGFTGKYYVIRAYNRELTAEEVAANHAVDEARFTPGTFTWTGATSSNWADASNWTTGGVVAVRAPHDGDTVVIPSGKSVTVSANVYGLASLTVEGSLDIASDVAVGAYTAERGGSALARGIYAGTGGTGSATVAWVSGAGVLRVAGAANVDIPSKVPVPAGDGWYEFGLASGYSHNYGLGYSATVNYHYIVGDHPVWNDYAFPAGAKLRLVGGILLETVPAGWFSQYDMSGLKVVFLHGSTAFADGTALTVPSGAIFRYQSGTWIPDATVANKYWLINNGSSTITYTGDIVNSGTIRITGDGTQSPLQTYTGHMSGNGNLYLNNFAKQGRFQGRYDMVGTLSGLQCGCLVWFDTLSIGGKFTSATLNSCGDQWATNGSWCANGIMFGKDNSNATADHELRIDSLGGNAYEKVDPKGKRWRHGGHAVVWGNNTLHVGDLWGGLHVMARGGDQHCTQGWLTSSVGGRGIGNIIVDKISSGTIYASTNVNVLVGNVVSASTKFDYTFQSGALNGMTLDITNGCPSGVEVKATDIGMLPARLSGFAGSVTLTDTATKSYTMPIDFTHGTNYLYNKVGCIGSGNLAAAPSAGSINVTFPTTGDKPVKGEYALARFTSGGERLANWTVTLNGAPASKTVATACGMAIEVKKDETGLWLDVRQPGVTLTLR